jgi:hypothetical protein
MAQDGQLHEEARAAAPISFINFLYNFFFSRIEALLNTLREWIKARVRRAVCSAMHATKKKNRNHSRLEGFGGCRAV